MIRIPLIDPIELTNFFNSLLGESPFPRTLEFSVCREGESPYRVHLKDQDDFGLVRDFMLEQMIIGNIYFRVPENIGGIFIHLHALCINLDFQETQKKAVEDKVNHLPYPPSCIVSTGEGENLYWFLSSPLNLRSGPENNVARRLQQWLIPVLSGHQVLATSSQILRAPFTLNWKYQPPRRVLMQYLEPARKYSVKQLEDWLRSSHKSGECNE